MGDVRPLSTDARCFAFVFPMASGHLNPSLPVARSLVQLGHQVHYLCREQMREAIEDTGATFHSEIEHEPEMHEGRQPSIIGALDDIKKEYGLESESMVTARPLLQEIMVELMLPGVIRWLRKLEATTVVYCPTFSAEAAYAAKVVGIPSVALQSTAGPGSVPKALSAMLAMRGLSVEDVAQKRHDFQPLHDCLRRLQATYGLTLSPAGMCEPPGKLDSVITSGLVLVTTCEALQDPVSEELAAVYQRTGVRFEAVGPLLDVEGARRAGAHRYGVEEAPVESCHPKDEAAVDPLVVLRQAKAAGRKVVLVSMGTVVTGDSSDYGWNARLLGTDGTPKGLTGGELCQAAWAGAFDAFGSTSDDMSAPLILLALGPQPVALKGMAVPGNAVCLPMLPQVDLLKAGVDVFLTHGGQNSFTEALAAAVPVVVCPGFADQPANAQKAVELGVGLQVERPMPELAEVREAAVAYREAVATALHEVLAGQRFQEAAARCSQQLRCAGGVPKAVELILQAGTSWSKAACDSRRPLAPIAGA